MVRSELVRILSDKLPELQARDVELAVNYMLEQRLLLWKMANVLRFVALAA